VVVLPSSVLVVGELHRREIISTLVLPSLNRKLFFKFLSLCVTLDVGEIHRVVIKYYSRSPLSEPDFVVLICLLFLIHVGEITQGSCFFN